MKAVHFKRLENVARALDESPEPDSFTMDTFAHPCGTPQCALGHYITRGDMQRTFELRGGLKTHWDGDLRWPVLKTDPTRALGFNDAAILVHFGIDADEAFELFADSGCDYAKTPKQAARYIRRFVARKRREQKAARS